MSWQNFILGDILKRRKSFEKIFPDKEYKLVTIKLYHKGVVLRSITKGSEIKSTMSSVKAGDFILSGIDARNGAFGIVPKELDGAIITNDFWCLEPDKNKIYTDFFLYLTSTSFFDSICKESSDGTTQRIRLQKDRFFNYKVELPSIEEQKIILAKLQRSGKIGEALSTELQHQNNLIKKLRQSILQDAVQGKLVAQNPKDEPAGELLKRIKAEKEKLIATGKLKKEKPLSPITKDEIPFELPKEWVWCRLGEIMDSFSGGYAFSSTDFKKDEKNQVLRLGNVKNDTILFNSNSVFVPDEIANEASTNELFVGDILITMTGTRLKRDYCFTVMLSDMDLENKRLFLNQRVGCMRFNKKMNLGLINIFLKADNLLDFIFKDETGTANQGNIGVNTIKSMLFPVPPFAEQNHIVSKVKELIQLCDKLEAEVANSKQRAEKLMQSVLREAFEGKKMPQLV